MRSMALAEGLYTWEGKELVLPEVYKYCTVLYRAVGSLPHVEPWGIGH
jgi:hypothetical protein